MIIIIAVSHTIEKANLLKLARKTCKKWNDISIYNDDEMDSIKQTEMKEK